MPFSQHRRQRSLPPEGETRNQPTVIRNRTIICIASSWDYDPTSKHHVMKILAEHNHIVWVNYHGTRRPKINRADLKAGLGVLRRVARGVCPVNERFVQITPLVIPGASNPLLRMANARMIIAQIRRAVAALPGVKERPVQVWCFAPDVPFLVGAFDEECFLYYCVDEYSEFEGVNAEQIIRHESRLLERADLVVTTSEALLQSKQRTRPDAMLVRHGVDFELFSQAWRSNLPTPADLASIKKPMFGFFGLIEFWIDLELIAHVARLRPQYSFVMIGESKLDTSILARLKNVHLLGRRPNASLPAYCASFDAGLLPFRNGSLTRNVNPIKMYEYLAAGLPVVSTPMPEAERFAGPISICESPEQFARSCDQVLATDYANRRKDISSVVENESWISKVEMIADLISSWTAQPLKEATIPARAVLPAAATATHKINAPR